ncbi:MAG: hypothetical protein RL660_2263 [Bacteroidota bacterium]|jgi:hypothetical protein
MQNLISKSLAIIAILYGFSILGQACRKNPVAKICKMEMTSNGTVYTPIATRLYIKISATRNMNQNVTCMRSMPSLIGTCNAWTEFVEWSNKFDPTSYVLTSNQALNVGGTTVPAGTNWLTAPSLVPHWRLNNNIDLGDGEIYTGCALDSAILSTISTAVKQHQMKFQCSTTDGVSLVDSTEVYFQ